VWCVYWMAWLLPGVRAEHYGLMLLAFGPLGLAAGQWLARAAPPTGNGSYPLPAYLTGYGALLVGTILVSHIPALLALILVYDALLLVFSAWLFKAPFWVYLAAVITPVSLTLALSEAGAPQNRYGWWLTGLAAVYLALAWLLRRAKLSAYGTGVLATGLIVILWGLLPSSLDQIGAFWGYGSAALLYAITAFWLRQPVLLTPASVFVIVPYAVSLQRSALPPEYYGLGLLTGGAVALGLGWLLDARLGGLSNFPWRHPLGWPRAIGKRLLKWWGLPLYTLGLGVASVSPLFTYARTDLSALNFLLLMPVFGWGIYRFRLRGWLVATALAGHLAAIVWLQALGWWRYPAHAWLRFLPVTVVTALAALAIERRRGEGSPLALKSVLIGWSRPLYAFVFLDVFYAQVGGMIGGTAAGAAVTLAHALLVTALASFWLSPRLPYLSAALGALALLQWVVSLASESTGGLPVVFALLALGYGVVGYGLTLFRGWPGRGRSLPPRLAIWETPVQRSSLAISFGVLLLTAWLGVDLAGWTVRAMIGMPFRRIVELETVWMAVRVLSVLGLLYVTAAAALHRLRLGYVAIGMLLGGWMLYAFYIQTWDNLARVQWYALPAGLYLLGIAFWEWQRGNRVLARWLDYAAMFLMLGSLFWQTLLFGWSYALLLGTEGFAAIWLGSARRLRRFLYTGMVWVILATLGQLIHSLQSILQWIVASIIVGVLLFALSAFIEQNLERIRTSFRETIETWE
ncbi:MAG: hypothetical protein ACE5GO_02675, partial [Anaerolineales bacterium]